MISVPKILSQVDAAIEQLRFQLPGPDVDFNAMSEEDLRDNLGKFGAYQGYLSVQLARLESTKVAVDRILNAKINHAMVQLEKSSDKRRLKDSLIAEIIGTDPELTELNQTAIEIEVEFIALSHVNEALESYWKTVSRILSSRGVEFGRS